MKERIVFFLKIYENQAYRRIANRFEISEYPYPKGLEALFNFDAKTIDKKAWQS